MRVLRLPEVLIGRFQKPCEKGKNTQFGGQAISKSIYFPEPQEKRTNTDPAWHVTSTREQLS